MIERKHFTDLFFTCSRVLTYKLSILNMTYKFTILRSCKYLDYRYDGFIMTPQFLFIPAIYLFNLSKMSDNIYQGDSVDLTDTKTLRKESELQILSSSFANNFQKEVCYLFEHHIQARFLMEPNPEYVYEVFSFMDYLDKRGNKLKKFQFMCERLIPMEIPEKLYHYMLNMVDESDNRMFKMHPLHDEDRILRWMLKEHREILTPVGKVTQENYSLMMESCTNIHNKVQMYYNAEYKKKFEKKKEEGAYDLNTMSSIYSDWEFNELTVKRLDYWFRTRHNIFGRVICNLMKWPFNGSFDVNIREEFKYHDTGSYLTPDYCYKDTRNNVVYLIDFAVTSSDPGSIRDFKKMKYEDLRSGLSVHLNLPVIFEAVVWKINDENNMQIPDFMAHSLTDIYHDDTIKSLKEFQMKIEMLPNYDRCKEILEKEEENFENNAQKLTDLRSLVSSILDTSSLTGKKTIDIDSSRDNSQVEDRKIIHVKESKFFEELEELSKLDYEEYMSLVASNMSDYLKKEELPEYLDSVVNFDKMKIKKEIERELQKGKSLRKKFESNINWQLPRVFKFPHLKVAGNKMLEKYESFPIRLFPELMRLDDGTMIIRDLHVEPDKKEEYNVEGIGLDEEEDTEFFDMVINYLLSDNMEGGEDLGFSKPNLKESELNFAPFLWDKKWYRDLIRTNAWEIIYLWAELMENLCYLEGRRFVLNKGAGNFVCKNFGKYFLLLKKGSKLTAQKQIKFKVIAHKMDVNFLDLRIFQKWEDLDEHEDLAQTKWLTISITDIRHFVKIREVTLSILSDIVDKTKEAYLRENEDINLVNKSFITMILILMEHRRGTSTSAQLNRYLMHSATGFITNRLKLIQDINSTPIRSRLEAYIRILQFKWYECMTELCEEMWKNRLSTMQATDTSYDRIWMPSFFDINNKIEFSLMMNEIYVSNLFDKESGFTDHRTKGIVAKMMEAEKHFLENKENNFSKGNVENLQSFWKKKDELHEFDRKFVVAATKFHFSKLENKLKLQEAMLKALMGVIDEAMMMTSSLKAGPFKSEALEFSERVERSKSFLTIYDEVEKLSTNMLVALVSDKDILEAVFSIFPKAQIGGPREILIQSIRTRLFIKFLETLAKEYCRYHPKEMLTKERQKAEIQSNTMSEYKEKLTYFRKNKIMSSFAAFNMDATRWSPGFVMEHFCHFVYNWDIDEKLKEFMLTCLFSFSYKIMLTPENLKDKWKKKPFNEKEYLEPVEMFRRMSDKNGGFVEVKSGMGQGMLHFLSSIYHCIMDDACDEIINRLMDEDFSTTVWSKTLISSDDKTKMMLFKFNTMSSIKAVKSMIYYVVMMDLLYRLANIHTNWKKSAFQFHVTEFNSLFSIGKRMCWATIKDIYNANSVPDLTAPEEAVIFMLSNIRRCLEHGMYHPTIKNMIFLARNQLIRYYRYDYSTIKKLCELLDCKPENLPFQLGFVPMSMIFETLIYGPDIHMFTVPKHSKLYEFYKKTYAAIKDPEVKKSRRVVPFSEVSSGKFWFELPTKLDKRLIEIKNTFFKEKLRKDPEEVMNLLDINSLNVHSPQTDMSNFLDFCRGFFIGMNRKYEFQETMVVHSLVRALQLSGAKGIIYPKTYKLQEAEAELTSLKKHNLKTEWEEERILTLETEIQNENVDVVMYTKFILDRDEKNSSINMLSGLEKVVENHKKNMYLLDKMNKIRKHTHPSMRMMRFYTDDVGITSSEKDMLDYMFSAEKDITNSTIHSFNHLMRMSPLMMDKKEIFKNPFKFIKDMMCSDVLPMKSFKDFLTYHNKSIKNIKVVMISDTYCAGNARQNMLNLYRTKLYPAYVLEDLDRITVNEDDLIYLTNVSLKNFGPIEQFVMRNMGFPEYRVDEEYQKHREVVDWQNEGLNTFDPEKYNEEMPKSMLTEETLAEWNKKMTEEEKRDLLSVKLEEVSGHSTSEELEINDRVSYLLNLKNIQKRSEHHKCVDLPDGPCAILAMPSLLGICACDWKDYFQDRYDRGWFDLFEIMDFIRDKTGLKVVLRKDNKMFDFDQFKKDDKDELYLEISFTGDYNAGHWYDGKLCIWNPSKSEEFKRFKELMEEESNHSMKTSIDDEIEENLGQMSEEELINWDDDNMTQEAKISMNKVKMRIESTDTAVTRARKYAEFCYKYPQPSEFLEMDRVEYACFHVKKINSDRRIWYQSPVLIVSDENTKENLVTNRIYCVGNLDPIKNSMILSVFKRFLMEMEEKEKRVVYPSQSISLEDTGIKYIKVNDLLVETYYEFRASVWDQHLRFMVKAENLDVENKIRVLRDKYTINRLAVKKMKILNQFDEEISFSELMEDTPELSVLSEILMKNNWVGNRLFRRQNEKEEDQEKMKKDLRSFNESLASVSMLDNLDKLLALGKIEDLKPQDKTRDMSSDMTYDKESFRLEVDERWVEFAEKLKSFIPTTETEDSMEGSNTRDYLLNEKTSMHNLLYMLVENSFKQSITVNRNVMMRFWKRANLNSMPKSFHNALLNQLHFIYPEIPDSVLSISYAICLKKMSREMLSYMSSDLELKEMNYESLFKKSTTMVEKLELDEESEGDIDEVIAEMETE